MEPSPTHNDYYDSTMISSPSFQGRSFNKRLDATHLDIAPDDNSFFASFTRIITGLVSRFLRPRQVIVILRLLKALTFCTLCLIIIANLMFVFFVEITVSTDVSIKLGGFRDRINRLYGVGLAILSILIELDMKVVNDHFVGLKPFLVRSFLLLFVSSLSGASPMISYENKQYRAYVRGNGSYNNGYKYYNDDDNNSSATFSSMIRDEVPGSAVAFQNITSFFLLICALSYFMLGVLCLDRFTARAFLADDDQVAAAITQTAIRDVSRRNSFESYPNQSGTESYGRGGAYKSPGNYSPERSYA